MMSLRIVYYCYAAVCVLSGGACAWVLPALPPTPPALVMKGPVAAVIKLGTATRGVSRISSGLFLATEASGGDSVDIKDIKDNGTGFIKVYLVSSATELEAVTFADFDEETVPKVPFDLNYIKNMVETDVGSSASLEYFDGIQWKPLTDLSALALYKRLAKFKYMDVIPLRVPTHYVGDDDIDGVRYSRR